MGLVWVMKTAMGLDSSIPCSRRSWWAVATSSAEGKTCGSMRVGVGLELVEEGGAVAEGFEDAEVVGDLAEARVEVEVGGG